jgi:hypothetical protein
VDRQSHLPSPLRVIPTWLVMGFAAGLALLALLSLLGRPVGEGQPSPLYVSGVVIEVRPGASPGGPAFLIRTDDGETLALEVRGTAQPSLPPGFLESLVAGGMPVIVGYTVADGQNVVLSIIEAPPSQSGAPSRSPN